jgi:rhodanese-related sulfurtransferase
MSSSVSPQALQDLLKNNAQFALIDVREAGEYNSAHIPGSSWIPRRQLEFQMATSVPCQGVHIILCDDDGRRARLAAATVERIGYTQVSVLEGGINWWATLNYPTEWGVNVPSKDFGEKMEVVHHVPEIEATELHEWMEQGKKMVILDTRTPEEHQRFCIPGGRSMPGGELALRITDITKNLDKDTPIIVHCAGRTRSIIGARMLQRMGFSNVYGLKNGTSGWVLAGYQLEAGSDRVELPLVSLEGLATAEDYAARLAAEDGVRYLSIQRLQEVMGKRYQETVYLIDVRTKDEYEAGHIPDFRWFPGGQVVQRSDDVAVVKNSTVIFACDRKARATFVASWYRQMGFQESYIVDGGTTAWARHGLALEKGMTEPPPFGLVEARKKVHLLSPQALLASRTPVVIFVDTSQDFARGHVPGARWVPRGWLELQIEGLASDKNTPIAITCLDGRNATLAGATLVVLGYRSVSVLDGGMGAWQKAGLPVEKGLSGVMAPPTDMVPAGPDRTYADMMNYLRWEETLGHKYAAHQP